MVPRSLGCPAQPRRSKVWWKPAAAALTLSLSLALCAGSASANALWGKGDGFLKRAQADKPSSGWSSVILKVAGELTPAHRQQIQDLGGYVYRHLPLIESAAVRIPAKNLQRLAELDFVQRLSADVTVQKSDEFTVGSSGADIAFSQQGLTGKGIAIAVVDSGISLRPDLDASTSAHSRVIAGVNFADGNKTDDKCGHGTHIAGIIAGNGYASAAGNCFRTFYGIARQANLVNVRVLDKNGQGSVSSVIKGIQWVVDNRARYNIRVMNLSLGHGVGQSYQTDPLCQAVEAAYREGITVVVAAGNNGRLQDVPDPTLDNEGYGTAYGTINSPGNSPYVITVGAMKAGSNGRASDKIATYSGRGPSRLDLILKPDIVAPGNQVIALATKNSYLGDAHGATNDIPQKDYCNTPLNKSSADYFRLSGTSMAAPVVAGAAALMLEKDPSLSPDTIKARLMVTANKITHPDGTPDACTFGAGYINIPAALKSTLVAGAPATSPALVRDENGNVSIDMNTVLWGTHVIWGTQVLWGTHIIWGTHVIWGTNTLSNSTVLWGTSVWADNILWGVTTNGVDLSSTAIQGEN